MNDLEVIIISLLFMIVNMIFCSNESNPPLPRVTEEMLRAEYYIPDTTDEPLCTR